MQADQQAHSKRPCKSSPRVPQSLPRPILSKLLETLVDVAKNGRSDVARVSAANALLDRGYGKPAVKEEIEAIDLPPVVIQIKAPDDDATERLVDL